MSGMDVRDTRGGSGSELFQNIHLEAKNNKTPINQVYEEDKFKPLSNEKLKLL